MTIYFEEETPNANEVKPAPRVPIGGGQLALAN